MDSIGMRIKQAIESRGFNQSEVARAAGMTEVSLSRYISDSREPKVSKLKAIAEVLDVSVDWLVGVQGGQSRILNQPYKDDDVLDGITIGERIHNQTSFDDMRIERKKNEKTDKGVLGHGLLVNSTRAAICDLKGILDILYDAAINDNGFRVIINHNPKAFRTEYSVFVSRKDGEDDKTEED